MSHREKKRKDADVIHDSGVKSVEIPKEPAREDHRAKKRYANFLNSNKGIAGEEGDKEPAKEENIGGKLKSARFDSESEEARKMPAKKETKKNKRNDSESEEAREMPAKKETKKKKRNDSESEEAREMPAKKETKKKKKRNDSKSEEARRMPATKETKKKKKRNDSESEEARRMPATKKKEFEEKEVINISDTSTETQSEGVSTKQAKKERRGKKRSNAELQDKTDLYSGSKKRLKRCVVRALSTNRRVTIKKSEGNILVDIREYSDRRGQPKRTKTGILLTHEEWKVLKENTAVIDRTIQELG